MTTDDVLALFHTNRDHPKVQGRLTPSYGITSFGFNSLDFKADPRFSNVSQFDMRFFDDRLSQFSVSYEGPPWKNVNDMVEKTSKALNLPSADKWTDRGADTKIIKCDGFDVTVTGRSSACCSYIAVEIPDLWGRSNARRDAEEEKARQEFKP